MFNQLTHNTSADAFLSYRFLSMLMRCVSAPKSLWDERRGLFSALVKENRGRALRVTQQNQDYRPQKWVSDHTYRPHAYRTMLHNEVVFDIDTTDWWSCVKQTHTLWSTLNFMRVPYWGALSGGKGTHTHVFIHPPELRDMFVDEVLLAVNDILSTTVIVDGVRFKYETDAFDADPRLLRPDEGTRVVREFGVRKTFTKTLWVKGPQGFRPIPLNRPHAYRLAGTVVPVEIPRAVFRDHGTSVVEQET